MVKRSFVGNRPSLQVYQIERSKESESEKRPFICPTGWPICFVTALRTVYLSNAVTEHIGHPVVFETVKESLDLKLRKAEVSSMVPLMHQMFLFFKLSYCKS